MYLTSADVEVSAVELTIDMQNGRLWQK